MDQFEHNETLAEHRTQSWPVFWTAVWVGSLTALSVALVIGLTGIALGAHVSGPGHEIVSWRTDYTIGALIFSVLGAFLAFAAGGWVAVRIAGIKLSEPAMLHGAIVWTVAVPIIVTLAGLGAGSFLGGWYGGLAGTPSWAAHAPAADTRALTPTDVEAARVRADRIARNTALGAVTALLLGLMGSVVGAWAASGEPMTFTHHLHRKELAERNRTFAREAQIPREAIAR